MRLEVDVWCAPVWRVRCEGLRNAVELNGCVGYVMYHSPDGQGLTLVHFSAQLEPCLTQENTLHTLNTT
jgi:hypothetical protein